MEYHPTNGKIKSIPQVYQTTFKPRFYKFINQRLFENFVNASTTILVNYNMQISAVVFRLGQKKNCYVALTQPKFKN